MFSCIYGCLLTIIFQELYVHGSKALFPVVFLGEPILPFCHLGSKDQPHVIRLVASTVAC